jgi:glycosyltransferase involved in cell wall biosynthesis
LFELLESSEPNFRLRMVLGGMRHARAFEGDGRGRIYLNVGHTGLNQAGFRRWASSADVKPVYLVHDLIPITHPAFCRAPEAEKHRERMRTVLQTGAGVIGNSRSTLDELERFGRCEGLPVPPSLAAWLGTDPVEHGSGRSVTDRPTFVTVGTIEARKNHLLLLEIWSRLIDRFGRQAPRLLIIGQRGWKAEPVFEMLDHDAKLRGHVVELNHCSDEELGAHLASARALLFPSHAEGYGLPLIEALRLKVPVIASDLPIFKEIAGEIPTYLNSNDSAGWEAAILEYSKNPSKARDDQVRRMSLFRSPSWDSHFEAVETWLSGLR